MFQRSLVFIRNANLQDYTGPVIYRSIITEIARKLTRGLLTRVLQMYRAVYGHGFRGRNLQ